MTRTVPFAAAMAATVLFVFQPAQAANLISANVTGVAATGTIGTLRAGSPWAPASAPTALTSVADDAFVPEGQLWTQGSVWWDDDPSVNALPVSLTIQLGGPVSFDRFVVQADDNDSYLLEYWDGGAWQTAWAIDFKPSFGLVTRDSGVLGSTITTDALRFSATAGDNYYAVSEIQGFLTAVPEPTSWAMMMAGIAAVGFQMRRARRPRAARLA
ncbi:MAG TPA: PEPxxWA-CTERM sorting domain-containing protein [Sphingobium sp.]|nr:PEPxxWA-CTERM sorting domain-containing protein [Sphingobium sp.]